MTGAIVVMGVTGCGKSTLGEALARELEWKFIEGDALHPPENVEKMAAGNPLDDADREPFLTNVANVIAARRRDGVVVSCSALRRSYRDLIRNRAGEVKFVLPLVDRDSIAARLAARKDHFMPADLLDSQLAALEMPESDEDIIVIDGTVPTSVQVVSVTTQLAHAGIVRAEAEE